MRVAVLGAGVVGVTTAYYLANSGAEVVLIERAPQAATETSHANGAQLSYSYTDPLAQPNMPARLPGLALGRDPAIRVRLLGNASLLPWGLRFLRECGRARSRGNMLAVLDLAARSQRLLDELREAVPLEFHWRRAGKIVVIADDNDVDDLREKTEAKRARGCDLRLVDRDEAIAIEPALAAMRQRLATAVYAPNDEVGDAAAFSIGLADWLQREKSVDCRFGAAVERLEVADGRFQSVETDSGRIEADAAVVCLGPWSNDILQPLGAGLPICPVRGYSVTLPCGAAAPSVSVTNVEKRIVFSRLGDRVRIAGFADFFGRNRDGDGERIDALVATARSVAPQAADYEAERRAEWGGFRPVTPDSRPLVGATRVGGLYLNTGHGVLGWTLACATAADLAEAIL